MGRKQLRDRFEIRGWDDMNSMIGDAYTDFCERMRYCIPTADHNRARWPTHELWRAVTQTIEIDLHENIAGVLPRDVKDANCDAHMRMLDRQLLGLFISRAAASGVTAGAFSDFMESHVNALHPPQYARDQRQIPPAFGERYDQDEPPERFAQDSRNQSHWIADDWNPRAQQTPKSPAVIPVGRLCQPCGRGGKPAVVGETYQETPDGPVDDRAQHIAHCRHRPQQPEWIRAAKGERHEDGLGLRGQQCRRHQCGGEQTSERQHFRRASASDGEGRL